MTAPGWRAASSATASERFFKCLLLLGCRRPGMLRPWALKGPADGAQCLPAALLGYRRQPEFGGHDRRRLLRRPHPAVVGRELDPLAHRRENLGRQDFRLGAVALAPVAEARRTEAIVAFDKFLDPAPHEAGQPRHLGAAPPLRQQPDHLVVPGQRRILAFPPARLKLGPGCAAGPAARRRRRHSRNARRPRSPSAGRGRAARPRRR
jgi:hypothetical protein